MLCWANSNLQDIGIVAWFEGDWGVKGAKGLQARFHTLTENERKEIEKARQEKLPCWWAWIYSPIRGKIVRYDDRTEEVRELDREGWFVK